MTDYDTFSNNGARQMEFHSSDERENSEHSSVGFVEIAKTSATWDAFFLGTESFDRI